MKKIIFTITTTALFLALSVKGNAQEVAQNKPDSISTSTDEFVYQKPEVSASGESFSVTPAKGTIYTSGNTTFVRESDVKNPKILAQIKFLRKQGHDIKVVKQ